MNLSGVDFNRLTNPVGVEAPPLINIDTGEDLTVRELAELVCKIAGFEGELIFGTSRPDGTPRELLDVSRINAMGGRRKLISKGDPSRIRDGKGALRYQRRLAVGQNYGCLILNHRAAASFHRLLVPAYARTPHSGHLSTVLWITSGLAGRYLASRNFV